MSDKISSPEQATQDNTIKVINIAANNFLILIESIIPFLLNKSDKQGKDNNTSHEQHPKTTNGCRNNIYYISAITIFDTNNRNYQSYKNTKDIDPPPMQNVHHTQKSMVDIITSYDAAIFAVIMDKPDEPIIVPEHHLPKQYYLLLKKVEFYCNHHHYGKAMMIFDEVHEDADRKIAEAITGFLFKTKFGRSFHHILEMPLFVSSAVTPAVQFADIFAGIVRHYYENELDQKEPETEFQEWLVALFAKLHNLTENNFIPKSHYLEYGFQKMGKNFSYPVSEKFTTSDNDESLLCEEISNDLSE